MSESDLPPGSPPLPQPERGAPRARPADSGSRGMGSPGMPPPPEGRPVSFYLAIFLALLLFVSGGLNLLLLFFSAMGSVTSGFSTYAEEGDGGYEIVAVAGDVSASDTILRVPIQGAIGEQQSALIGGGGGTISQVRRALRTATNDDSIRGVLLDINSPGGGVTDSDEVWRLIREFREETAKPVLALFGDISASGGYYIAAACNKILARPTTITGSIGVIMQSFNVSEAMQTIGVKQETIISDSTPYKDILSMTRAMKPEERQILTSIVDELYDRFVDIVDEGRPRLTREQVSLLANGAIYSAQQAKENGLVDGIVNIDEAYDELCVMASIDSARVVEHRRRPTLGEALFGARSAAAPAASSLQAAAAQLLTSTSGPRFLYYWTGAR